MTDLKPEVLEAAGRQLRSVCGKIDQIFAQRDPPSQQEWSAIYEREVKSIFAVANLVPVGYVVVPVELQAVLQAQHDWHLGQTDEDQWGIIPADAYAESVLSDRTVSALQKAKYAAATEAVEPEGEDE